MTFIEKYKAFILSFLVMSIFAVGMLNLKLSSLKVASEKTSYAIDFVEPEILEKLLEEIDKPREATSIETHRVFNEAEKATEGKETSISEAKAASKSEVVREKSIDEQILEELAQEEDMLTALDHAAEALKKSAAQKPKKKKKEVTKADDTSKDLAFANAANRNTSMYYNLEGRKVFDFPNPIYTCGASGKIVVNIIVDHYGSVVETSFNQASSTSTNGCLIDKAMEYAGRAKFSASGNDLQKGTITYIFPGHERN